MTREEPYPQDALPPCEGCPKPELSPSNRDVVYVFRKVMNNQDRAAMSGHYFGLRFESVIAAATWAEESGNIDDRDVVIERMHIIEEVTNRIRNARIDAQIEASKQK